VHTRVNAYSTRGAASFPLLSPSSSPPLLDCFTNMNWTGGSLQRTKHANKGIVQKQKAHFAKARNHCQDGPKLPAVPFRPSYLGVDNSFELSGHLPSYGRGSVRHTGHTARPRYAPAQRVHSPDDHTVHTDDRATTVLKAVLPKLVHGGGVFALKKAESGSAGILATLWSTARECGCYSNQQIY
jgi:hypothetical protein